jgi:hypothetical protein
MLNRIVKTASAALVVVCMASASAAVEDPASIMSKSRDMRKGLTNSFSDVVMTINAGGQTIQRTMRQFVLEVPNDGNRTINVFSKPADVNGVSVLTHSALNGNDKQWLNLPSVGRVKRISSSNRSGAFVGSEFAYEDLASFEVEKYTYQGVEMVNRGGKQTYAVTYIPKYSGSGYTRLRSFLDTKTYQPVEIQFFNRRGEHAKTLNLSKYKSYGSGKVWRPHRLVMTNHRNGDVTRIDFSTFQSNGTSKANFNSNRFASVR